MMMASSQPKDDTFYDVLKVEKKATIAEIVAAYHSAKNAFSRDSMATYSLFSPEEAKSILDKLEEAYLTLSNIDKKREYDRWLTEKSSGMMIPPSMTELERSKNANPMPKEAEASRAAAAGATARGGEAMAPMQLSSDAPVTGIVMKEIREKRGLSVDDVSRITKIPAKFIRAIESDDAKGLPARVYLQGFVKNLASVYKLDVKHTINAYLSHVDKITQPAAT